MIREVLEKSLRRLLIYRLINRAFLWFCLTGAGYQLMVLLSAVLPISRLFVHLVLLGMGSLLPVILIFQIHRDALRATLRTIDTNCLIESFLAAEGEVKRFIETKAIQVLEQQGTPRQRFKLNKLVIWSGLALVLGIIGNLSLSMNRFGAPALTLERQQELAFEMAADERADDFADTYAVDEDSPAAEPERNRLVEEEMGGGRMETDSPEGKDTADSTAQRTGEPEQNIQEMEEGPEPGGQPEKEQAGGGESTKPSGPGPQDNREGDVLAAGDGVTPQTGMRMARREGPENTNRSAGKSLLDSPLLEYETRTESLETDDEAERIAASDRFSDEAKTALLHRVFSSFSQGDIFGPDSALELEEIGARYLREMQDRKEAVTP